MDSDTKRFIWRQNSIALNSNLSKLGRRLGSFYLNSLLIGCHAEDHHCLPCYESLNGSPLLFYTERYWTYIPAAYWSCFLTYVLGYINTVFFLNVTGWFSVSYHRQSSDSSTVFAHRDYALWYRWLKTSVQYDIRNCSRSTRKNPYVLEGIILSQFLSIKASFLYSSAVLTVED